MGDALSSQMVAVYDNHRSRSNELLEQYQISWGPNDLDELLFKIRNSFLLGVHRAFQEAILQALIKKLGSQQRVAEALGLKDRTSISQMKRSGTMDGVRLTAALYQLADDLTLPSPETVAAFGFAQATSYIKSIAYKDNSLEGSMTAQEFSYLVGVLANDEWESAIRNPDPRLARGIAKQVIEERAITGEAKTILERCRPEQLVFILQRTLIEWGDFGLLALCSIPECIPENEKYEEVTL